MTTLQKRLKEASEFLEAIQKRIDNDNGAKAALKRALSGEPQHWFDMYPIVLPHLKRSNDEELQRFLEYRQRHIWIPVVCLFAHYPQEIRPVDKQRHFGDSCLDLKLKTESNGPERRFRALLETDLENLPTPLAALVRLMKQKKVSIDYPYLIVDLERWQSADLYIQDRWAKAFWQVPKPPTDDTAQESDNSDTEASSDASN